MLDNHDEVMRTIRIRIVRHRTNGLMVAVSDDLRGLMVAGETEREIEAKLSGAVREILEAKGDNGLTPIGRKPI